MSTRQSSTASPPKATSTLRSIPKSTPMRWLWSSKPSPATRMWTASCRSSSNRCRWSTKPADRPTWRSPLPAWTPPGSANSGASRPRCRSIDLASLPEETVVLSKAAADDLDANVGDTLTIFYGNHPSAHRCRDRSGHGPERRGQHRDRRHGDVARPSPAPDQSAERAQYHRDLEQGRRSRQPRPTREVVDRLSPRSPASLWATRHSSRIL